MDLVTLFQTVPPLLPACVDDNGRLIGGNNTSLVRSLRLVNKDASRVALLGLRCFTLTLTGPLWKRNTNSKDSNIRSARLLQHASLEHLKVTLHLSGSYSPAIMLKDFLREVGASLRTVTSLDMHYTDIGNNRFTAAILHEVMSTLADACPDLKSLTYQGQLPVAFLKQLGAACPSLTKLTFHWSTADLRYLPEMLLLQPSLLPHISSLVITGLDIPIFIPNMAQNIGITSLVMQAMRMEADHWLRLPRKLQHLKCNMMIGAPPPCTDSTDLLSSLLSAKFDIVNMRLPELAQLLREGPFPHQISTGRFDLQCSVDLSTAADLALLSERMQMDATNRFDHEICIRCTGEAAEAGEVYDTIFASLPSMSHVIECSLDCKHANLLPMLRAFPKIQDLSIRNCDALAQGLGNLELHALAACKELERVDLESCSSVGPMGLLELCKHLPSLAILKFSDCRWLKWPDLTAFVQLVHHGLQIEIIDRDAEGSAAGFSD